MRKVLKWLGIVLAGLVGLVLVGVVTIYVISELRLRRTYDIEVAPIVVPTDEASIEHGRHLAHTWTGCIFCHGDQLEGDILSDDPEGDPEGLLVAPNLTSGEGGIGADYSDEDWVRAIRHLVKPNGRGIIFMFETFNRLSDEEVGSIIAYMRTLPPVDNVLPESQIRFPGRLGVLLAHGFFIPASAIDHEAPRPPVPPPGVNAAYGEHIARSICVHCHGTDFAGGVFPEGAGGPFSEDRPPRNLTPAGNLANWTEEDFFEAINTGVTPEGYALDSEEMPWPEISTFSEDDLTAIWLFLETLPPTPTPEA